MIAITLRRIMECTPCYDPIEKGIFPKDWDVDAPISFRWLADKIPPEDVIWCFFKLPDDRDALKRHFSVDCAERVRHLMTDDRSLIALIMARKYAFSEVSDAELHSARTAAWDAAWDAAQGVALATARRAAAWAATADMSTAQQSAWNAALAAAWASTPRDESWNAALNAARNAEMQWQMQRILELTDTGEWSPVGK